MTPKSHPILSAFCYDISSISSNFYDIDRNPWILDKDLCGRFKWRSLPPWQQRGSLPPVLREKDLDSVPLFLMALAKSVGLNHQINSDPLPDHKSEVVLAPVEDPRMNGEINVDCPKLPEGVFILLESVRSILFVRFSDYPGEPRYGMLLSGLPCVVTIGPYRDNNVAKAILPMSKTDEWELLTC